MLSRVPLLATPWTAAYQAPLPMGFSRQEYWSGVPLPFPTTKHRDLNSQPGIELLPPALEDSLNHWTAGEVAYFIFLRFQSDYPLVQHFLEDRLPSSSLVPLIYVAVS